MTGIQRLPAPARVWTAACVVLFLALSWQLRDYTPDDAFISFAYAQQHAAGNGWVASEGAQPVEGFSNPLYVFVLELAARAGLPIVATAKTIGLACGAFLVLATGALAWVTMRSVIAVCVSTMAIATWPPMALWSASGMENSLYGLCLVMGSFTLIRESVAAKSSVWSVVWWGAAMWIRPEAFGLAAVAAVWCFLTRPGVALRWIGLLAIGLTGLLTWRYTTFGEWLPNTYYAKRNNLLLDNGWNYLWLGTKSLGLGALPILFTPVFGLLFLFRGIRLPATFVSGVAFAQVVFVVIVGGDWMLHFRFLTPLAPFIFVLGSDLFVQLRDWSKRDPRVVGGYTLYPMIVLMWAISWPWMWKQVNVDRSVDITSEEWEPYRETLESLEHALGPSASLVVPELGYPSFATNLRVLDPLGLGSAHVAHLRYERIDRLLRDVWQPDAIKVHSLVSDALKLHRNRWFRDGFIPIDPNPDWPSVREVPETWYVSRTVFERSPDEIAAFGGARFTLDGGLELHDVRCVPAAVRPGEPVYLQLTWMPTTAETPDFDYAVAVLSPRGSDVGATAPALHGWLPSASWQAGVGIVDRIPLPNSVDAVPGVHKVALRFLDTESNAALPITYGAGIGARTNDVRTQFDVIRELSRGRVDDISARITPLIAEGHFQEAWDVLAPARAAESLSADLDAKVRAVGSALARTELESISQQLVDGVPNDARGRIDQARAYAGADWEALREAFVDELMRDMPRGTPAVAPSWDQILRGALAAHVKPESQELQKHMREFWRVRVEADRRENVLAAETSALAQAGYGQNGNRVVFQPALSIVQTGGPMLSVTFPSASDSPDALVQLLMFGSYGYEVVSIPLQEFGPLEEDGSTTVTLSGELVGETVVVRIAAADDFDRTFRVGSIATNPWGAPFYPPIAPRLCAVQVLVADESISHADVQLRVQSPTSRSPVEAADIQLPDDFDLRSLAEVRDYELAPVFNP